MSVEIDTSRVPIVDYLQLGECPHLLANQCLSCEARFFDRRNACGACGATGFTTVQVDNQAVLKAFSIVHRAAPTVKVPFVSAILETKDGTTVRSNIVGLDDLADAELGMALELTTYVCGIDDDGTECMAFGYVQLNQDLTTTETRDGIGD